MNKIERNISYGDCILATVSERGNVIAKVNQTDFNSISEIMVSLRNQSKNGHHGITQLFIRNFTQGWCINSPLLLQ